MQTAHHVIKLKKQQQQQQHFARYSTCGTKGKRVKNGTDDKSSTYNLIIFFSSYVTLVLESLCQVLVKWKQTNDRVREYRPSVLGF